MQTVKHLKQSDTLIQCRGSTMLAVSKESKKQDLSKTSKVDLTSNEKDYKPFWDDSCEEISSHLLSHIQIDSSVLESTSLNTCSSKIVENSWFFTERKFHQNNNSQRTYLKSYTSSLVEECKNLEKSQIKSRKIRIYPINSRRFYLRDGLEYQENSIMKP